MNRSIFTQSKICPLPSVLCPLPALEPNYLTDAVLGEMMETVVRFDRRQIILWLVEFQEGKAKFSIFRLLRYVTDMTESHPDALVIPTVLFTDRKRWRRDVTKELDHRFGEKQFLHFEYIHPHSAV